ncbi:hypothetical protein AB3N59_03895 [Leptospira sp. WS92.C1]
MREPNSNISGSLNFENKIEKLFYHVICHWLELLSFFKEEHAANRIKINKNRIFHLTFFYLKQTV